MAIQKGTNLKNYIEDIKHTDLIRQIFLNTNREYFVLHTDLTDHTDLCLRQFLIMGFLDL